MKLCAARECGRPVGERGAKGLCPLHYRRLRRFGDANFDPRPPARVKFAQHAIPGDPEQCWEWTGRRDSDGYGTFSVKCYPTRAHRFAWTQANGAIPDGLHVLHHCDNPPCVNPAHLFVGTNRDNHEDKMAKGRNRANPDPWASQRRLTAEQVEEIRAFGNPHRHARSELAKKYGVTYQHIMAIQRGQRR
jgi:hypothetical protein